MEKLKGHPIFEQSEKTLACIRVLRGVNFEISDKAMSESVGFTVTGSTPAVQSARKHLEKVEGVVFERIYGEGFRRLDDTNKVRSTARHVRQISRTARRGMKRLDTIDSFENLSPSDQLTATLRNTQFQFIRSAMTTPKDDSKMQAANNDLSDVLKNFTRR